MKLRVNLEQLRKSVCKHVDLSNADVVFLTGSTIEGLELEDSDLDLVVISEERTSTRKVRASKIELEFMSYEMLEMYADSIRGIGDTEHRRIDFWTLVKCHRFMIGYPIINEARFFTIHRSFPWQDLLRFVLDDYLRGSAVYHEEAIRASRSGADNMAICCARASLELAVDAAILIRGEWNPKPKWRWAKIERVFPKEEARGIFDLIVFSRGAEHASSYVRRSLDMAQNLRSGVRQEVQENGIPEWRVSH